MPSIENALFHIFRVSESSASDVLNTRIHSMAAFKTLLVFVISVNALFNGCPEHQNTSCASLRSSAGFTYQRNITCSGHCEQGWYFQNGTHIVDPCYSGERLPVVTDVTLESLTLSVCANLQWQIECVEPEVKNCKVNYTVADSTEEHKQDDNNKCKAAFSGSEILFIVIAALALTLTAAA